MKTNKVTIADNMQEVVNNVINKGNNKEIKIKRNNTKGKSNKGSIVNSSSTNTNSNVKVSKNDTTKGKSNETIVNVNTNGNSNTKRNRNETIVRHLYENKQQQDLSHLPGPTYPLLPDKSDSAAGKLARIGNKTIAKALMENHFKISKAAQALHCSHYSLKKYIDKSKDLAELLLNGKESELDYVEDKLMDQIKVNNMTAIIFYLKCMGKTRGWIDRDKDEQMNKPNVTFKYTLVMPGQNKKQINMGTIIADEDKR